MVLGLETKGRPDLNQWVTSFMVKSSLDSVLWRAVDNGRGFDGNVDINSTVVSSFTHGVLAKYIRERLTMAALTTHIRSDAAYTYIQIGRAHV